MMKEKIHTIYLKKTDYRANCKNPIIVVDFLQLASEYFYFITIKGIKNTPHLYRLVLACKLTRVLAMYFCKNLYSFIKKMVNIEDFVEFESIKELDNSQYEIKITDADLITFAQVCAHACDYIKSDRNAKRLDTIAYMLETYVDGL